MLPPKSLPHHVFASLVQVEGKPQATRRRREVGAHGLILADCLSPCGPIETHPGQTWAAPWMARTMCAGSQHNAPSRPWPPRGRLVLDLDRLAQEPIGDEAAKVTIFDAVYRGIVPQRLLPVVAQNFFAAEQREYLDCVPRTRFGLHNAFTRALKALAPAPAFEANLGLGPMPVS